MARLFQLNSARARSNPRAPIWWHKFRLLRRSFIVAAHPSTSFGFTRNPVCVCKIASKTPPDRPPTTAFPAALASRKTMRQGKRSEEHTSELQSLRHLVCRLLLEKKNQPVPHRSLPVDVGGR